MAINAPSVLTATAGADKIVLAWTNNQPPNYEKIYVERKVSGGSWTQAKILPVVATWDDNAGDNGIWDGIDYVYRVRAWSLAEGLSGYSNEDNDNIVLSPPTGLVMVNEGSADIDKLFNWTNAPDYGEYDTVEVARQVSGGGYSTIATLAGNKESFWDSNITVEGVQYDWKVRGTRGSINSNYTSFISFTPPLGSPWNLEGTATSNTTVELNWRDNSYSETGFAIYKDGTQIDTVGANVTTYEATGLTAGAYHKFKVRAYNASVVSKFSNVVNVFTDDPPSAPSNLMAVSVSTAGINLTWRDNSRNETRFYLEQSLTGVGAWAATTPAYVSANVITFSVTGLASATKYFYRVRSYNASGYSRYSNIANAITHAATAVPSNLVATARSDSDIEITFQDNSTSEDSHRIERKLGPGAYAEIVSLAPNRQYYRDTGVAAGGVYTYRARAEQGAVFTGYGNEDSATAQSANATPANLSIDSVGVNHMQLSWDIVSNAVNYTLQISTDGAAYSTYGQVMDKDIISLKVIRLSADTQYWFKVRSLNAVGNSAYSGAVNDTTDASHTETDYQVAIRDTNPKLVYLDEINPKLDFSGFTATGGGLANTYEIDCDVDRIDIVNVYENNVALTEYTNSTDVNSNAGSFFFDIYTRVLYVHTSGSDDPVDYLIEGECWLYIASFQNEDMDITFNDNQYLNLLKRESIPDLSEQITPLYEGSFIVASGLVSYSQRKYPDGWFWDRLYKRMTWRNRKIVRKVGLEGFSYSDYHTIATMIINDVSINQRTIEFDTRDYREGLEVTLPPNRLKVDDFSAMDSSLEGTPIPLCYYAKLKGLMFWTDYSNKRGIFHEGRINSIQEVRRNKENVLVENTDYYIDYQRGRILFDEDYEVLEDDSIEIDFTGIEDDRETEMKRAGDIFYRIAVDYLGLTNDELNLDELIYLRQNSTESCVIYLSDEESSTDIIRKIERTVQAYSFQDESAKLGMKTVLTSAPGDIRYLQNHQIFSYMHSKSRDDLYKDIVIKYDVNPQTGEPSEFRLLNNVISWKYREGRELEIETYSEDATDAETVANAFASSINKDKIEIETSQVLYTVKAGDLIYITKDRFFNLDQAANLLLVRVLEINKQISSRKTILVCEAV